MKGVIGVDEITIILDRQDVLRELQTSRFHEQLDRFREAPRQQEALTNAFIVQQSWMSLAKSDGEIIGYAIILEPEEDERWTKLDYLKVLGVVEVAPGFRGKQVGKRILRALTEQYRELERYIVISLEYSWHWDVKSVGGDFLLYKRFLKKLLESAQFTEVKTNEPDILANEYNFMMARIGSEVTDEQIETFYQLAYPRRSH